MSESTNSPSQNGSSRRRFLQTSGAAMVAGSLAANLAISRSAHAAGSDVLRLGLIGCGGRGTGAAAQALTADANTRLVAMADAFEDQLTKSLANLQTQKIASRAQVDRERQFVGLDAYQKLLDSDVDVVLLAAPPHFRPIHLKAAVEAGKQVFAEKPVAVDAPGIRSVLETCRLAKEKNLNVVSGLCWRYETGMQEVMKRLHDGALGAIVAVQASRHNTYVRKTIPRSAEMGDMEWQLRNWYFHTWLSADFMAEQFVHELDKVAWAMKDEYPLRCTCLGGRQTRVGPEYGNIYDHFFAIFEYANGAKLFASTRQQPGCSTVNTVQILGDRGASDIKAYRITGDNPWRWRGKRTNMHQLEHDAFFAALRKGEVINNGDYMAKSTMMALMARMSAYTGQTITWEQAMNSQQDLSPPRYAWDVPLKVAPVALPGLTEFA